MPTNAEEDAWQTAIRPDLPLRNDAGEEVSEEAWTTEHRESDAGLWTKKISDWASGNFLAYRLGKRTRVDSLSGERSKSEANAGAILREAIPSEDFEICAMMLETLS